MSAAAPFALEIIQGPSCPSLPTEATVKMPCAVATSTMSSAGVFASHPAGPPIDMLMTLHPACIAFTKAWRICAFSVSRFRYDQLVRCARRRRSCRRCSQEAVGTRVSPCACGSGKMRSHTKHSKARLGSDAREAIVVRQGTNDARNVRAVRIASRVCRNPEHKKG